MNNTPKKQKSQTTLTRFEAFNNIPCYAVDKDVLPSMETIRQADIIFEEIQNSPKFKTHKLLDKKKFFRLLLHTSKIASYHSGCIRYSRNTNDRNFSKADNQVIEICIELGLFEHFKSPPGSPKMSRILPTLNLTEMFELDPWEFDPSKITQYVYLRDRETKQEMEIDKTHNTYKEFQKKLTLVNNTNRQHSITCKKVDETTEKLGKRIIIRPVHYAVFTGNLQTHGRIYTGKYGHQSLTKLERQTIEFNSEETVEVDYSGFHPRILYNLEGIDYREDPYLLWDEDTTPELRMLAKVLLNALVNARSDEAAIGACNRKMSTKTENGARKTGAGLARARRLYEAYKKSKTTYRKILPVLKRKHKNISHMFNSDFGVKLMNYDALLGLDILTHFAKLGDPCLGCHDSFIGSESNEGRLRRTMIKVYRDRFSYTPVLSESES